MTQLDLNDPIAVELGRLTIRAVTAETRLAHALAENADLKAQLERGAGKRRRRTWRRPRRDT